MSIHQQIAVAVSDQIATINGIPRIVVRQQAFRLKSDPTTLVIVTRGADVPGNYVFGGSIMREYEIVVTILYEQGMKLESGIDDAKTLRQRIRQVLVPAHDSSDKPIPSLPIVWDVEAIDLPEEPDRDSMTGYETAMLGLVYRTNENYRG